MPLASGRKSRLRRLVQLRVGALRALIIGLLNISLAQVAQAYEPVVRYTLANGMHVRLQPDRRAPRVALAVSYPGGSSLDPEGFHGLAHVVEHLMFASTAGRQGHLLRRFEELGATHMNGSTSSDFTSYAVTLPAQQWRHGVWLEAQRMAFMLNRTDVARLERERATVLNELHLRSHNTRSRFGKLLYGKLYPPSHPYHEPFYKHDRIKILTEELNAIDLNAVRWFHQRYYRPDNAMLAMIGDFEVAEARALIERTFGPIQPVGPKPPERPVPVVFKRRKEYYMRGPSPEIIIGWSVPHYGTKEDAALDVAARHLKSRTGPLRVAAEVDETVLDAYAAQLSRAIASTFVVGLRVAPGIEIFEYERSLLVKVARFLEQGITPQRFRWCQRQLRLSILKELQSLSDRAIHLSRWGESLERQLARYSALEHSDTIRVIRQLLKEEHSVSVMVTVPPPIKDSGS